VNHNFWVSDPGLPRDPCVLHSGVMFAKRLPVLTAFAGGCLCTAALLGFSAGAPEARAPAAGERQASLLLSPLEAAPEAAPPIQPEPAPPPSPSRDDDAPSEPSGSSVADVLSRLEAAYQQVAAASAAAAPASLAPAIPEPAPEPTAATIVVPPSAVVSDAPEPAPAPPLVTAVAAPEPAPPAPAPPAKTASAESAPITYVAELTQNVHVGDVHQGDRYQLEQRYQIEQLAMIQYLQLLALSSYAGLPQTRAVPGHTHRPRQSRRAPITVIPNPDNPWGFNFPPPALVK